ncbi:hypothetical protein TIFTF001_001500 [Ficus carica]|uniref:Uncharacterized protein n=1 Tax=Ficus carica TaxID=3494 RepID=A0AA87YZC7_FICCA|nr:hypothetical protein TIFTF001_001500 [Ficus carica]
MYGGSGRRRGFEGSSAGGRGIWTASGVGGSSAEGEGGLVGVGGGVLGLIGFRGADLVGGARRGRRRKEGVGF